MANCTPGYTHVTEFAIHDVCDVSEFNVSVLRWLLVACSGACFAIVFVFWILRGRLYWTKPLAPRLFLMLAPAGLAVIFVHSVVGVTHPARCAVTSLFAAVLVHLSGSFAALTVVIFLFIEIQLINHSYRGLGGVPLKPVPWLVLALGSLEICLFLTNAVAGYYWRATFSQRLAFWIPAMMLILTLAPLAGTFGTVVYLRLRRAKDGGTNRDRLARRVLATSVSVTTLILVAGVFAGIALSNLLPAGDWFYLELCWFAATFVMAFLFFFLSRAKRRRTDSTDRSRRAATSGSERAGGSTITVTTLSPRDTMTIESNASVCVVSPGRVIALSE